MIWSIEVPDDVEYVDNQVFYCLNFAIMTCLVHVSPLLLCWLLPASSELRNTTENGNAAQLFGISKTDVVG